MEKLVEFLTWQNFFTGTGFVFGIITLIAYLDQKSTNRKQSEILDFVKNENNKKLVVELEKTKANLENEIVEKIPGLGKRAILEEQMEFYKKVVADNYKELKEIEKQVGHESLNKINLSPTIKNYILSELYPKYHLTELKNQTRDRIILFIGTVVLSSIFAPLGIDIYLKILFGLYLIYEIIKLFILNSSSSDAQLEIYKNLLLILRITFLTSSTFCFFILQNQWSEILEEIDTFHIIILVLMIFSILIVLFSSKIINKFKNSITKELDGVI